MFTLFTSQSLGTWWPKATDVVYDLAHFYFPHATSLTVDLHGHVVHGVSQALHVLAGDTRHAHAPGAGHVDVVLARQPVDHLAGHSADAEHADLVGDVGPLLGGTRACR